jgi:hypothetical protein
MTDQTEQEGIYRSIVTDQPGCPVAAPCAISGCQYAAIDASLLALRASVEEKVRELRAKAASARTRRYNSTAWSAVAFELDAVADQLST